jgi:hypothetical protein
VRLVGLILANYFDDFCVIEPAFSKAGHTHLRAFASLIRVPFGEAFLGDGRSKVHMAPSAEGAFLGVEHDFFTFASNGKVTSKVSDDSILRSILASRSFSGSSGVYERVERLHFTLGWVTALIGQPFTRLPPQIRAWLSPTMPVHPLNSCSSYLRTSKVAYSGCPACSPSWMVR